MFGPESQRTAPSNGSMQQTSGKKTADGPHIRASEDDLTTVDLDKLLDDYHTRNVSGSSLEAWKEGLATSRRERLAKIIEDTVSAIEHEIFQELQGRGSPHSRHSPDSHKEAQKGWRSSSSAIPSTVLQDQDDNRLLAELPRIAEPEASFLQEPFTIFSVDGAATMDGLERSSEPGTSSATEPPSFTSLVVQDGRQSQHLFQLMPEWETLARESMEAPAPQGASPVGSPEDKLNFTCAATSYSETQKPERSVRKDIRGLSMLAQTGTSSTADTYAGASWFTMHPSSKFRMTWDVLACAFLAYDCYIIPLTSVFDVSIHSSSALFWPTLAAVVYWTIDIGLSFVLGYHLPDGQVELDAWKILHRYFVTWFWPELLILAADWLNLMDAQLARGSGSGVGDASRWIRLLRLARLARLFRIRKLIRAIDIFHTYTIILESTSLLLGISRNVFFIVFLNHGIASIWYSLGLEYQNDGGWLAGRQSDDWFRNYIMAMEWSIANFTPGASSTRTEATVEMAFHVIVLFFALVVFSVFVSSTTTLIASLVKMQSGRQQKMLRLKRFMNQHHIPAKLRDRVLRYALRALETSRDIVRHQEVELLALLSEPLRQEVGCFSQMTVLKKHGFMHKLFRGHAALKVKICVDAVAEVWFSKGDLIFITGEAREKMSCVVSGKLVYRKNPKHRTVEDMQSEKSNPTPWSRVSLHEDEWFCEPAIWILHWYCKGDMSAGDDCHTLDLSGHALQKVIAAYPIASQFVVRYATAFLHDLNSTAAASAANNDTLSDLYCFDLEPEFGKSEYRIRTMRAAGGD
mmetsp:Transcript_42023/g.98598  ORF Transcript_42023/g.98598 Transcript_42023/m.98598 type:complete len:803 (-) Transcript_42023:34-2442(-)